MTEVLRVAGLTISFGGGETVVSDVSFALRQGEIFGLIGPNGAGKTTTIRMLLHILQHDRGEVSLFGRPLDAEARDRIGYLPEERGLYRQVRTLEVLTYMARLKGLPSTQASDRARQILEQMGLAEHALKKVSELSRGMSQLVQFGATIIHEPDVVVLDEPFSGLDPVNTERLKDVVAGLQGRGAAVIFSTHMMASVEELCDRVMMIDRGRAVLHGPVDEVKERFRNNSLYVQWDGLRNRIQGVAKWQDRGPYWEAFLSGGATAESVLQEILGAGGTLKRFQLSSPSLHEVFIRVAGQDATRDG